MELHRVDDGIELGKRIRERRKELGMSQEEVAFASQVTLRIMSELERGKPTAQYQTVMRVLGALGLNLYLRAR
jgi:y4mF family transcriptional regulator